MSKARPAWVWAISLFFLAASLAISAAFVLALTGVLPLAPAQQAYLDKLTPVDFMLIGSVMTANLAGAFYLVQMRGAALPLLMVGWGAGLFELGWHAIAKGWLAALGAPGVAGFVAANLLSLIIIVYALGLARRGILR
jgi:hypothetical protein